MEVCTYRYDLCDACSEEAVEKDMFEKRSAFYRHKCIRLNEEQEKILKKTARLTEQLGAERKKTSRLEEQLSEARKMIETLKTHAQKASLFEAAIKKIDQKVSEKDAENECLRQLNMRFAIDLKVLQEMVRTFAEKVNHQDRILIIADRTEAKHHALYHKIRNDPLLGSAFETLLEESPIPRTNASQYFFGGE